MSVAQSRWLQLSQTVPWGMSAHPLRCPSRITRAYSFVVADGPALVLTASYALDGGRDDGTKQELTTPQEKRYRSMQEHIRRAHPEHYIAKLPATEESFQLMINTPPNDPSRPPAQIQQSQQASQGMFVPYLYQGALPPPHKSTNPWIDQS